MKPLRLVVVAVINAGVFICRRVPEVLTRFVVRLLIHSAYRLDKHGLGHIPAQGPALIVCNHVSFVDPLVIMAACPRPIRFVMDHRIFRIPLLNFVFRQARAIPVAPARENVRLLERAYDEIARALAAGELVAIFPEGGITATGELHPFKNGIARILRRTPVPVVPMALRGLWGSFFSRKGARAMTRPLRRGLYSKIALAVAPAVAPAAATPADLQRIVAQLRGDRK